jgi:PAS domain S-box-containing protein
MTILSTLYGYGVAMVAAAVAVGLTLGLRYTTNSPTFFLFYAAIFVSIWFYGRGPGWLTTVLACVATIPLLPDQFPGPVVHVAVLPTRLPTVLAFVLCATTADWLSTRRHRTEAALRAARAGLEQTVLERTQALREANQKLSAEIEERQQAEAAVRASEAYWRTIFEVSNVPMAVTDLSGRNSVYNRAAQRLLGYTSEELESLTNAAITHEDDYERTAPAYDDLITGRRSDYNFVKRYRCKDGSVKWVDVTVTRAPNPKGGEELVFSIFPDITQQKRVEMELREANKSLWAEIEERRRVETTLRASEEWWRRIFESSNVPMAVTGLNGYHLMVNHAAERTLGYTLEELRNLTIAELTHEDDRARTLPAFDALTQGTGGGYHVVKRYRCKDGRVKWLDASVTRLRYPRSGEDVIVAVVVDITEQKRVEAELRGSEERWRRVFEGSAVPMALADNNRRIVATNPACEKLLGYTHDEFMTMSALDFAADGDREACARGLSLLECGEHQHIVGEIRFQRKDGEVIWVNASTSYVPPTETTPALFPAVIEDVTQRRRAETALRASEERWRAMFTHAPTAIAMVGADHRLVETNPACHRMLGYSVDEFQELTPMDISLDGDRDLTEILLPQLIDGRCESARTEKRYRKKDGGVVWADATFFHVPATEGSPGFTTAIVVDITERKRAEEALRRTQSELARAARIMTMGELTASIAHEVNQPLAAVVASGNACRRWLTTEPPNLLRAQESLNRIVGDANRASEVIARVRAHTKNSLPEQVEIQINDIVEGVLFFTRGELESRQITVQMELHHDVCPVLGDKVQLQQVILNLVMNAVEAMASITDRQRVLTVKSHNTSPTEVQITVCDNGPGLDLGNSDRIFDAFFTTRSDGMGMGLSISRSIIEAHGGRLWTSPASPHGSEFHFVLPTLRASES